ncbi:MAG: polyphosphate polymerase domain-containing protein [Bacillota bacterium]
MKKNLRYEIKYIISLEKFIKLQKVIKRIFIPDPNNEVYIVRSLYFDSYTNKDLYDTLSGVSKKGKLRLRMYNYNKSTIQLEYKQKIKSLVSKKKIKLNTKETEKLINNNYNFLLNKTKTSKLIYFKLITEGYTPKILIDYKRYAYVYPSNNTRITFDLNTKSSLIYQNFLNKKINLNSTSLQNKCVLEVKFKDELLTFITNILSNIDKQSISNSKYRDSRMENI